MNNTITKNSTELKAALAEKQKEIDLSVNALRDILNAETAKKTDIAAKREAAAKSIEEWNELNISLIYAACYENDNPMLAACKYGAVTEKRLRETVTDAGRTTVEVNERKSRNVIDLVDFNARYNGENLFRNGQWIYYAEEFAKAIAGNIAHGLEISEAEQTKLMEAYKDALADNSFACLTKKNPSIANMTKDLQCLVDMILFIPDEKDETKNKLKVFSKDVRYIDARKARAGKTALATRVVRGKEMRNIIANVMYHLTTGNPYTID